MRIPTAFYALAITIIPVSSAHGQERYDNPVDHRSYVTEGEFKTYKPDSEQDTSGQSVVTNGIHLLTGEPDLKQRVRVEDLASFIKSAEDKAYPILAKNKASALVLVQFDCQPNRFEVKMASQGNPQESILQALYEAMKSLSPLKTKGEVIFQVELNVRP